MWRSHLLQKMQNYFDHSDVRSRENATALESQMLNLAAFELEDLTQRINRELVLTPQTVPTNIDNGGIYYSSVLPIALQPAIGITTFTNIIGLLNGTSITLTPYIDTLPVPSRITADSNNSVSFSNPLMFTAIGSGYSSNGPIQNYLVQYVQPGAFPIPNKLTVWVDEVGFHLVNVTITITGQVFPSSPWVSEQRTTTEVLNITQQGIATSVNAWSSINQIAIRNLPTGMRLRGYSMPFNLHAVIDLARPYSTPENRGVTFKRYWKIDHGLLKEMYQAGLFTGMETVNSYSLNENAPISSIELEDGIGSLLLEDDVDIITQESTPTILNFTGPIVDVAVESNTYGMYIASNSTLYYVDRREYQASLANTGLKTEPLYGLQVYYDITKTGTTRYVTLSATPYANSANIKQYRYIINNTNSILPTGALGPINAGWRSGAPVSVSIPLVPGDYQFQLQLQDTNGNITYDIVPFRNPIIAPLRAIDMSLELNNIKSIAYDSYGRLWAWDGTSATPLDIHYDGYIYDPTNTTIYTTEPYTSLQIIL